MLRAGIGAGIALASVVLAGPGQVRDVPAAFAALSERAQKIPFDLDASGLPTGGHVQGVQCRASEGERHCFVSGSADPFAYLLRVDLDASGATELRWLQNVSGSHPDWRHAGGFQLSGSVLAVGLEDAQGRLDSEVQFWDVEDLIAPRRLACTIARHGDARETHTAGAVGLVQSADRYVLVVANWDSRDLDFYATDSLLLDSDSCGFERVARWSASTADRWRWRPDREWGGYQALTLFVDPEQRLYVMGTYTAGGFWRRDVADLFFVDLEAAVPELLRKIATKRLHLDGARFRCGGGLIGLPPAQFALYATGCDLADFVLTEAR